MSVTIEGVEVRIDRGMHDKRKTVIVVQVMSRKQKGLFARHEVDPAEAGNVATTLRRIETSAGAAAEYLGEKYGDNIDPDNAARNAVKAFEEECRLLTALTQKAEKKIKRLEQSGSMLSAEEKQAVDFFKHIIKSGGQLLHGEAKYLNRLINKLHGRQL